ncbi:Na/Pi cotransporter family protein [Muriicola soli]|uniref:Na/Pi cotransporter family protein n=1 Tax=Muriicola soli TaxID=2507538 RepID=UPI001FEB94B9|nr:Na/Pi symporter [Muriicola soli]
MGEGLYWWFAVLFIGLQFLKENMPDINQNPGILEFLNDYTELGFSSVLLFLLIGTVLTIVVQSSSATMALTLLMTAEGWIPFDLAAAMVLGENIGTTITANLAAIVANFHAKRTARAHLIFNLLGVLWMLILFYPFLNLISWVAQQIGSESPYVNAAAIPVAISLFHTFFNVLNTFLLVWFITPISRIVVWSVPEKIEVEREIDEPKFLNQKMLQFPETAIASLLKESKYLFQNTIFEIVTHALNIHREDIKSELKAKKVVKKSIEDFKTDVRALYLSKVKNIYGEIIRYATNAQSTLKLTKVQNNRILEIKVANRKMVEVLRDVKELNRNVSIYFVSENKHIKKEYDLYRKLAVQVLRVIYNIPTDDTEELQKNLIVLRKKTNKKLSEHNVQIDHLIRKNLITTDMASSLVNDNDNVRDVLNNLITVAELLYCRSDTLFAPVNEQKESLIEVA